jgi:hypothetical protein
MSVVPKKFTKEVHLKQIPVEITENKELCTAVERVRM